MYIKIRITCLRCSRSAEIDNRFDFSNGYACPNCGAQMPQDELLALQNALSAMAALPEEFYGWDDGKPHFTFSGCQ